MLIDAFYAMFFIFLLLLHDYMTSGVRADPSDEKDRG